MADKEKKSTWLDEFVPDAPVKVEEPAWLKDYQLDSPIQLNPSGVKQPLGSELYTPQTKATAAEVAPYMGRLGANSLPMVGSTVGAIPGTIIGTIMSQGLKHMAPNLFGEPPKGNLRAIGQMGTEVVLNDVVPGLASVITDPAKLAGSRLLKNFPAVREGAVRQLSKQISSQYPRTQSQILTEAAQGAAIRPTTAQAAERGLIHNSGLSAGNVGLGNTQPEMFRRQLTDLLAGKGNYSDLGKEILKDVQTVRNFKLATGNPQITEELAINQLLRTGSDKANNTINARAILNQMGKSEVYKEAIGSEGMKRFEGFLNELQHQQRNPKFDYLLNYASGKLSFALTGALLGGPIGTTVAAGGGLALTNKILAKLMTNEETARLVVEAMRTPAGTPKANFILHAIGGLLNNPNQSKLAIGIRAIEDVATVPER